MIQAFQRDGAQQAGIFHHLITLPTYHTAALATDQLAKGYFGEKGMLGSQGIFFWRCGSESLR